MAWPARTPSRGCGRTHDTAAARIWDIFAALRDAGLIALGDKGYYGYDQTGQQVITPYKGRNKPESQKDTNRAHARLRGPANAPTPNSSTGASCTKSASVPAASANSPKPSTCRRTTKPPQDEKHSLLPVIRAGWLPPISVRLRTVTAR